MSDVTVYKSQATPESLTLPLGDWLLIEDLCAYAATHFDAPDAETGVAFQQAIARITRAVQSLTTLDDPAVLLSPASREVH